MHLETKLVGVENLSLDPQNPRLPSYLDRSEPSIIEFLAKSSSIEEIVSAIGSNGYFASEPLIAVEEEGRLVIVEGNRRLTALKILLGTEFEGMSNRLRSIIEEAEFRPDEVPVAIYENRADILNYLGNKHIAGVKPWSALAKARYAKQLLDASPAEDDYQARFKKVARMIGSRSDFISRAIKALEAYDQAERNDFYGLEGVGEDTVKFSLLSTALDYEGIQKFVYENPDDEPGHRRIIDEALSELFSWMFLKEGSGKTKLGESRNLMKLSTVVMSEEGLEKFRLGMPLEQAYTFTDGIDGEFDVLTIGVQSGLREANSIAADVKYSEERHQTVTSIAKQAKQLKNAFDDD